MEIACPRPGATPKQPSIGSSGDAATCSSPAGGWSSVGRAAARGRASTSPSSRPARAARRTNAGSTTGRPRRAAEAARPVRRQAVEVDGQRVARLGALDEERPGLRVARPAALAGRGVEAEPVDAQVTTVSPSLMRRTGSCEPIVGWKWVGSKTYGDQAEAHHGEDVLAVSSARGSAPRSSSSRSSRLRSSGSCGRAWKIPVAGRGDDLAVAAPAAPGARASGTCAGRRASPRPRG